MNKKKITIAIIIFLSFILISFLFANRIKSKIFFEIAKKHHIASKYDKAIEAYQKLLKIDPTNVNANIMFGFLYYQMGDMKKAEEKYLIALEINPESAKAHGYLGFLYHETGEIEDAIKHYKEAIELMPNSGSHFGLGEIYLDRKEYDKAENEYLTHIKYRPKYAQAYFALGELYLVTDRKQKALEYYTKAFEIDVSKIYAIINAGRIYESWGNYEKAIEIYSNAMKRVQSVPLTEALEQAQKKLYEQKEKSSSIK
jgi:tetratricopeptide (TPR) repeat protein